MVFDNDIQRKRPPGGVGERHITYIITATQLHFEEYKYIIATFYSFLIFHLVSLADKCLVAVSLIRDRDSPINPFIPFLFHQR